MPDTGEARQPSRFAWSRLLMLNAVAAICLALLAEIHYVYLGSNFHEVIPGRVFRCAQFTGDELAQMVRMHGIRTVINLRGYCAPQDWYMDEARAAQRLNVSLEDVCMSAGRFPSTHELRHLLSILDHAEYPVLIHCKQGADRTGLVSTLVRLLQTDTTLPQARWQLSPLFGHIALGRPANLDSFLDLYAAWLRGHDREHCGTALRQWLAEDSCPGMYRCRFEMLDFPTYVPPKQPTAFRLRVHNTSVKEWRFQPISHAGVHGCFGLRDLEGNFLHVGRAGMFDAVVAPGESIDLTFALPALAPGSYRLFIDMIDEAHCLFHQTGSEPLEMELQVE